MVKYLPFLLFLVLACSKKENKTDAPAQKSPAATNNTPAEPKKKAKKSPPPLPKDLPVPLKKMVKACEEGNPTSCKVLTSFFLKGISVKRDRTLARYFSKKTVANYKSILPSWEAQCEKQDPGACMNVAMVYRDGLSGVRDAKRAVKLFHAAAKTYRVRCEAEKTADACYRVARIYEQGLGKVKALAGDRSFKKAKKEMILKMYKRGCDLDSAKACGAYGDLARMGRYMKMDHPLANQLYTKACSLTEKTRHPEKRLCALAKIKKYPVTRPPVRTKK